jgi:thiol:disulfide interchange protein DsbC
MRKSLLPLVLILVGNYAMADAIPSKIKSRLDTVVPGYDASSVKQTPVPGLYEFIGSGRVLYISEDGRYIINGNVIDMESQQSLTEQSQRKVTLKIINGYDEKKMITFSPEGKPKHVITVFTDVDCPYCAMLHKEVPKLNKAGIEVRYLMYPRAGEGSPTYNKSVSTWCNSDQKKTISIAKEGGVVTPKTCDDPVKEQFELGKSIGITGTPTLILENGKILPGYVPAAQLIKILNEQV